jgi:hypothetical protein
LIYPRIKKKNGEKKDFKPLDLSGVPLSSVLCMSSLPFGQISTHDFENDKNDT